MDDLLSVMPTIPVQDLSDDRNFHDGARCMRAKYRHMGTVVKNMQTTDSTKVFQSASADDPSQSANLFFPWLGINAMEFGIGKIMCSLYHSSNAGSIRTRQEKAERIREKRKMEKRHREAQEQLRRAMEQAKTDTMDVCQPMVLSAAPVVAPVPVRRSRRLASQQVSAP